MQKTKEATAAVNCKKKLWKYAAKSNSKSKVNE